jgi:hypothetical protein
MDGFFRPLISLEAEHSDNSLYDFWRESRRQKKKPLAFMTILSRLARLFLSSSMERRKQTPVARKSRIRLLRGPDFRSRFESLS